MTDLVKDHPTFLERALAHRFIRALRLNFRLEAIVFYGVLITVFLAAIPYGTVADRYKSVIILLICVFSLLRVADNLLRGGFHLREKLVFIPLAGVLVLAIAQIIPLPLVSSEMHTISADVYETKAFITLFAAYLLVFEILLFYTTNRNRLRSLVFAVLVLAVGSVVFGLLRELTPIGEMPFLTRYFEPGVGFAQYINQNHFVYLMEMALGLLIGLLLRGNYSAGVRFGGWLLSAILVGTSILVNSRGGLLAITGLFAAGAFFHLTTRGSPETGANETHQTGFLRQRLLVKTIKALLAAVLVLAISVLIIAFVGGDIVVHRIEKIPREIEISSTNGSTRGAIWQSTVELIKEKPFFGAGFGAYGAAITRFDKAGGKFSPEQAHNDYLEIPANGGAVGFLLFGAFGWLIWRRVSAEFRSGDDFRRACCFGAALGIFGVLLHSIFEFGLHIVFNALIFIILLVIAAARIEPGEDAAG